MAQIPFVDITLENKLLRHLIIDDRVDDKNDSDTISSNVGFIINVGLGKEAFYSTFKQWIIENIVETFLKYSQTITRSVLLSEMESKYKGEDFKKKKVLLEKIFKHEYNQQNFKLLLDRLSSKYHYRSLFNLNKELHETLKKDFEEDRHVNAIELARGLNENTSKILLSTNKFRIVESDAFQNIDEDIDELLDRKENPDKYKGITTGYPVIDKITGGWRPGELIVVLGRPGSGKSVFCLNFGYHAFKERCNVLYFTIEMPYEQQKMRLMSLVTGTAYHRIKNAENLSDADVEHIRKVLEKERKKHKNYFRFIDAPETCNVSFIESRVVAFENVVGKKVDLIIVDPIYLMKPSVKTDDPVGTISWDLKLMARNLDVPVIAASQFNRSSHDRHKHGKGVDTADAAFSDKLAYNTDIMMGITGDKGRTKVSFPKTRDSLMHDIFFKKDLGCMRFEYTPVGLEEEEDIEETEEIKTTEENKETVTEQETT